VIVDLMNLVPEYSIFLDWVDFSGIANNDFLFWHRPKKETKKL